jgi:hypothetical protein
VILGDPLLIQVVPESAVHLVNEEVKGDAVVAVGHLNLRHTFTA